MPIQTVHPLYTDHKDRWDRCYDADAGDDAVKAAGTLYLPKLQEQTKDEYDAYKMRAVFYNATGRTVDGMVGLINRKPPVIELPEALEYLQESATRDNQGLTEFAKLMSERLLVSGRTGILIDRPTQPNESVYLTLYSAAEIINWREADDTTLILVVLAEGYFEADPKDPYKLALKVRYRELFLGVPEGNEQGQGVYQVRIWEKDEASGDYVVVEQIIPTISGQPLDHIPFVLVNPKGVSTEVENPPILDIVNINLAHYRNSADIEHGRHLTALPTPWVSGVDATDTGRQLPLGAGKAWRLPEGAQVGFLEFTGTGMASLAEGMNEKEQKMAALGARMIEPQRKGVEAAETARIHQAGANATLSDVAGAVGDGLKAALVEAAAWEGQGEDAINVDVNKDFVDTKLSPQELTALVDAYLKGAISQETLLHNLKIGEVLPESQTIEDEMSQLAQNNPDATNDGGAGQLSAQDSSESFDIERDSQGNVIRLVRTSA